MKSENISTHMPRYWSEYNCKHQHISPQKFERETYIWTWSIISTKAKIKTSTSKIASNVETRDTGLMCIKRRVEIEWNKKLISLFNRNLKIDTYWAFLILLGKSLKKLFRFKFTSQRPLPIKRDDPWKNCRLI
jgi:hypothetical protein